MITDHTLIFEQVIIWDKEGWATKGVIRDINNPSLAHNKNEVKSWLDNFVKFGVEQLSQCDEISDPKKTQSEHNFKISKLLFLTHECDVLKATAKLLNIKFEILPIENKTYKCIRVSYQYAN
jgi:hypothetical protein